MDVYLYQANAGFVVDKNNQVPYRLVAGKLIIDAAPKAIPGKKYQLAINRADTNEMVFASDAQLLVGIDDTAPKSLSGSGSYSPMSAAGPLRLYFNEAVKLGDFSVVKHYRDYTTHADEDVSARFELVKIGEQTISLRLLSGEHFDSNASYDISVNRITDMADQFGSR